MATKKITLNELKQLVKQLIKEEKSYINEYNNWDYPAGADADPSAPWNQGGEPDYDGYEIENDADNTVDFTIRIKNTAGCYFIVSLDKILNDLKLPEEEILYMEWAVEQFPRPDDFETKLDDLADSYQIYGEYECPEKDDYDYEPDDY